MIATVPLPMNYSDWKEECVVACVYVRECMCVCHRQLAQTLVKVENRWSRFLHSTD